MLMPFFKKMLLSLILTVVYSTLNYASNSPFCLNHPNPHKLIIGYLGSDSSWTLKDGDQKGLEEQLAKVSVINYAFIRLVKDEQGNTILAPSIQDIDNITLLRKIRPDLPIIMAIGGWGERDGFDSFLVDETKRAVFIKSVKALLMQYQLDGIDLDWENALLANQQEIAGVALLLNELHEIIGKEGYCVTNAVPGTQAYWTQYPDANLWQASVNWTTIMSYDHYGTFGPRTEHSSALYEPQRKNDGTYPYPTTSGDIAVQHFFQQGLPADKIILGLPFYCHSYYLKNTMINGNEESPGLHVPVLDPNISSQISYNDAYRVYGDQLSSYSLDLGDERFHAVSSYGLIPIKDTVISRFMSCEGPQTILDKISYVEGHNPLQITLGGVSFWSLQQDLPFSHPSSLLHAIHKGFEQEAAPNTQRHPERKRGISLKVARTLM
jgi:chitinase